MQENAGYDAILPPGAAAALVGVTPQTLREYERRGLLSVAKRTPAGQRRYSLQEINRLIRESTEEAPKVTFDNATIDSFVGKDIQINHKQALQRESLFKEQLAKAIKQEAD